jgi:hypothetical protein
VITRKIGLETPTLAAIPHARCRLCELLSGGVFPILSLSKVLRFYSAK